MLAVIQANTIKTESSKMKFFLEPVVTWPTSSIAWLNTLKTKQHTLDESWLTNRVCGPELVTVAACDLEAQ